MDLQSLRTFQAVVEEGGILSASRKLNTVQSNVTARIKRLETEVGTELFYRKGRGLELAPSGKVLLDYARQMLRLESQAELAVRQVGEQTGELRIGAMEIFAALRLPLALKSLRRIHPKLSLRVQTDTSAVLIDQVLDHKLDCAVVCGPVDHPELRVDEVTTEELVLVCAPDEDSGRLPLILFREGCAYRARALAWRRARGHHIDEVMEFGTLDGILGCVAVGLGSTLVPSWVVDQSRYREDLHMQAIDADLASVPTVLVRHRDTLPLKAMDTLFETVRAQCQPACCTSCTTAG